jgi:hypothetical protein
MKRLMSPARHPPVLLVIGRDPKGKKLDDFYISMFETRSGQHQNLKLLMKLSSEAI